MVGHNSAEARYCYLLEDQTHLQRSINGRLYETIAYFMCKVK